MKSRQTDDLPDATPCGVDVRRKRGLFLRFSVISLSLGVGRRDLAVTTKWVVTGLAKLLRPKDSPSFGTYEPW